MTRIAIIGIGHMGSYHLAVAQKDKNVEVAFVVHPERPTANIKNAQYTPRYTDIIGHVDAAIIATPTPTHFAIARDLLRAGIHVLVEKPISPTLAQAEELFALAQERNCVLHVGHVERFNPAFIAARQLLTDTPHHIRTMRSGPYHTRVADDSVVLDLMIHDIDLVCTLLNEEPHSIAAIGHSHVSAITNTASALLTFQNSIASCSVHRGAASTTRSFIIETPTQSINVDLAQRTVISTNGLQSTAIEVKSTNPLGEQLKHFCAAIKNGEVSCGTFDLAALKYTLEALLHTDGMPHSFRTGVTSTQKIKRKEKHQDSATV